MRVPPGATSGVLSDLAEINFTGASQRVPPGATSGVSDLAEIHFTGRVLSGATSGQPDPADFSQSQRVLPGAACRGLRYIILLMLRCSQFARMEKSDLNKISRFTTLQTAVYTRALLPLAGTPPTEERLRFFSGAINSISFSSSESLITVIECSSPLYSSLPSSAMSGMG